MEKRQLNFLKHLARAPTSQVVPTLKAASDADWRCLHKLCNSAVKGELPTVVLPKKAKRWFSGVARGIRYSPDPQGVPPLGLAKRGQHGPIARNCV